MGDFLMIMDGTDSFYRELLLNPRATSIDIYLHSNYHGSKPQLLDVVALADIYKRCIEVYDEKVVLLLIAGRLWTDKQKIMLCYWKDSGFFDSIRTPDWKCDNEQLPGMMEERALDLPDDEVIQCFRREVFALNPNHHIPTVESRSECSQN